MAGGMAQTGMVLALSTLSGKAPYGLPSDFMALMSTVPTATAMGTEVTAPQMTNYGRKALPGASWGASTGGQATYNALADFLASTGGSGTTVVGYEIWDAQTGGTRIWWGTLTSTPIATGTDVTFPAGAITVTIPILAAGNGYSTAYANRLVDHFTGRTAFGAAPTLNAALTTAASTAAALGTELGYTGYARTVMPVASLNAAAAVPASTVSAASNTAPISITTTAPHGLVTGDIVTVTGVVGNTAANVVGTAITVTSPTTFTLNGTTGNGAYTSGGTVTPNAVNVASNAQLNFPQATGAGTANVIGWAYMDSAGTPALICAGTVTSIAIAANTTPDFPAGTSFLRLT